MLVSLKHQFAFFSNLKYATISIDKYLAKHCEVSINSTKHGKHSKPRNFKELNLFIERESNVVSIKEICTVRDPIDKIISWYTYRSRPKLKRIRPDRYLGNTDFKDFSRAQTGKCSLNFFYNSSKGDFDIDFAVPIQHFKSLETFFQNTLKSNQELSRRNASRSKNTEDTSHYKQIALEELNSASSNFINGTKIYNKIVNYCNDLDENHTIKISKIFQ